MMQQHEQPANTRLPSPSPQRCTAHLSGPPIDAIGVVTCVVARTQVRQGRHTVLILVPRASQAAGPAVAPGVVGGASPRVLHAACCGAIPPVGALRHERGHLQGLGGVRPLLAPRRGPAGQEAGVRVGWVARDRPYAPGSTDDMPAGSQVVGSC
jgi:hypothetical protein